MNITHKLSLATIIIIIASVSILVYVDSAYADREREFVTPLKALNKGANILEVACDPWFIKEYKSSNLMPICIKEESKEPLLERGFIKLRIFLPGDEQTHETLCLSYPDVELVQRHC